MEGMIGEVRLFGGNFAPRSWALCEGQLLAITSNEALFSIIGTIYGGDGRTTFALPDLRGRVAVGNGNGSGLSSVRLGEKSGRNQLNVLTPNLPSHSHPLNASSSPADQRSPQGNVFGSPQVEVERGAAARPVNAYTSSGSSALFASAIGSTGGGIPVDITNPVLGLNYIICLFGVFPSRN